MDENKIRILMMEIIQMERKNARSGKHSDVVMAQTEAKLIVERMKQRF